MSLIYLIAGILAFWLVCTGWYIYLIHTDCGSYCDCKNGECKREKRCEP